MNINLCMTRKKHYIQTNNKNKPFDSCNVTIMTAGLDISGRGLKPINNIKCEYDQPEDKLRYYIETNATVQNFYKRNFNINIPAPEWAGVMVFAVNYLYGESIIYYDEYLTYNDIKEDLQNGLPIYTSMRYLENKNASGIFAPVHGHIVLIVGINEDDSLIINDPYKNHLTGGSDGFNNVYVKEEFLKHNKGYAIRYKKA